MEKTSFSAIVELPYSKDEVTIDVELDKDIDHLTYDEVEMAISKKIEDKYGYPKEDADIEDDSAFPNIIDIVVNDVDGESYPVISESMDDTKLKKSKSFTKYLVLPDAHYQLTPECKLWLELQKNGIIDEDDEFDFDKCHALLENMSAKE